MDFQKQIDTITGALNLFDLSYLVSGSAMLLVLSYTYPSLQHFLVHDDKLLLSAVICIVAAYIAGLFCWVIGKRFRYVVMMIIKWDRHAVEHDFEELFGEAMGVCKVEERSKISQMQSKSKSLTYSYMWMKLDKSTDIDCKRRFDFISRFWTFRAIYEGLILPFVILAIAFYYRGCVASNSVNISNMGWIDWGRIVIYVLFCLLVTYALCMEARKCFKTQLREVVLAFSIFCPDDLIKTK